MGVRTLVAADRFVDDLVALEDAVEGGEGWRRPDDHQTL